MHYSGINRSAQDQKNSSGWFHFSFDFGTCRFKYLKVGQAALVDRVCLRHLWGCFCPPPLPPSFGRTSVLPRFPVLFALSCRPSVIRTVAIQALCVPKT